MKLARVLFEDVMELEGSITFPEGKAVVIYGENKAGKSNIIHALRYAFLSKVVKPKIRTSGYDELRLVTGKEIAPAEGEGKISVEFEHGGREFKIQRDIDRYKDSNKILRKEADGFRELDFVKTVDKELKAGLLDALFAPDSAMGFKHLNEKDIDAVIRELFKEIGNAKVLSKKFKERVQRLREEGAARVSNIERDYDSFVCRLRGELRDVPLDLGDLEKYESGKTAEKISTIANQLRAYVDSLEKGELKEWMGEMKKRAQDAEEIDELLGKNQELRACFKIAEEVVQDRECLNSLVAALREAELGGPMPGVPGKFHDGELDKRARIIYQNLEEALNRYSNALALAQEENVDFRADNPARIKSDKEKVLGLLSRQVLTGDAQRVRVDLVRLSSENGEVSVHGLVPLKLMDEDPAFTKLSPEPIPEASEEQKREYAQALRRKIGNLGLICEGKGLAESFFSGEFIRELSHISEYGAALMEREKNEREKISRAVAQIQSKLLLFTQQRVEMPKLECEGDIEPFLLGVRQIVSARKSEYEFALVSKAKGLGIQAGEFSTQEIGSLLLRVADMEKGVPLRKAIWTELTTQRRIEWERNDLEHIDLTCVPAVVDGIDRALDAVLDNAFDEQEVIAGIREIMVDINSKLVDEGLINSCIEVGEGSLQLSKTMYKDREITHPCGAERSFFSLAALTALARYFGLPVIIDEAANNLDRDHLRHFVSLIREFSASYDVQYILSIKQTDDFPLDGWVREFADDLQIYQVGYDGHKKYIRPIDLHA